MSGRGDPPATPWCRRHASRWQVSSISRIWQTTGETTAARTHSASKHWRFFAAFTASAIAP